MIKVKSLEIREIEYSYERRPKINGMNDVINAVKPLIADVNKEFFIALYLNTKNCILRQAVISIGSLNANIVHPREVFRTACMVSASSIIVVHNHPSGVRLKGASCQQFNKNSGLLTMSCGQHLT
jgi:DNA repair protein RadC